MQDKFRRLTIVFVVFAISMLMLVYYSVEKSGMFIDEIYSYGLSNGEYTPFITDVYERDIIDKIYTSEQLTDYLIVDEDEGFDYGSVYYNQTKDVHPPLYYFMLNEVCSVFRGGFTKWTGLALNMVIHFMTLLLLYKTAKKLFSSETVPPLVVFLYGLSSMGLSTALMIRMYCLSTMFSVLLLYLLISYGECKRWYKAVFIGLTVFAGLMTHYYFVIYAFILCFVFLIRFIRRREYKAAVGFAVPAFAGVGAMVAVFPAVIDHLFSDKLVSGESAVSNIADPLGYPKRIAKFALDIINEMPVVVLVGIILLVYVVILARNKKIDLKAYLSRTHAVGVTVSVVVALCAAAILAPVHTSRYIYNLAPAFVIVAGYLMDMVFGADVKSKAHSVMTTVIVSVTVILSFAGAYIISPDYLFPEQIEINETVSEYSDSVCIYFNDNYNSPLTQDLLQLRQFDEVFVTNSAESDALEEYLAGKSDASSVVVYVDVSKFWSSGFDAEEVIGEFMGKFGYTSYEVMYKYGLSETYVVTK